VKDGALLQEHVDLLNVGLGNKGQLLESALELAVILGNGAVDLLDDAAGGTLGAVGVGLELGEFLGVHDGYLEECTVLHFRQPKVHVSAASNTYAIYGRGEEKELTELVPGILNQLGPDSLASLRKLAESYQQSAAGQAALAAEGDDEVPDLVESFEEASIDEAKETTA